MVVYLLPTSVVYYNNDIDLVTVKINHGFKNTPQLHR